MSNRFQLVPDVMTRLKAIAHPVRIFLLSRRHEDLSPLREDIVRAALRALPSMAAAVTLATVFALVKACLVVIGKAARATIDITDRLQLTHAALKGRYLDGSARMRTLREFTQCNDMLGRAVFLKR